jgi:hypothetical protein
MRTYAPFALGLVVGLLLMPGGRVLRSSNDWHAREITQWCNYYRGVAAAALQRTKNRMLANTESDKVGLAETSLRIGSMQQWFARCAGHEILPMQGNPRDAEALVCYLEGVVSAIPQRIADDPAQYVQPVSDLSVVDFF